MPSLAGRRKRKQILKTEERQHFIPKRGETEFITEHRGARYVRTGPGRHPVVFFRMWAPTKLRATSGEDCGLYYDVRHLPVGPRHNGKLGFKETPDGCLYEPHLFLQNGWRYFDELPKGWQDVNAEAIGKYKRFADEAARGAFHNLAADMTKAVEVVGAALQHGGAHNAIASGAIDGPGPGEADEAGRGGSQGKGKRGS